MADPRTGDSALAELGCPSRPKPRFKTHARSPPRITLAVVGFLVLGLVGLTAVVGIGYTTTTRPNANADFQTATTVVYYNDGKSQLGSFAVQNRQPLTFEEMPQSIKDAVVAAENRTSGPIRASRSAACSAPPG